MTASPDFDKNDSGTFKVENDTTGGYWHHRADNTLPPPDMMGPICATGPCRAIASKAVRR